MWLSWDVRLPSTSTLKVTLGGNYHPLTCGGHWTQRQPGAPLPSQLQDLRPCLWYVRSMRWGGWWAWVKPMLPSPVSLMTLSQLPNLCEPQLPLLHKEKGEIHFLRYLGEASELCWEAFGTETLHGKHWFPCLLPLPSRAIIHLILTTACAVGGVQMRKPRLREVATVLTLVASLSISLTLM